MTAARADERKLLLIDDDRALGTLLETYLKQFGFRLLVAHEPNAGLELLSREQPELVILDVMLPGKDGFQVCREIRAKSERIGILMLTARGEVTDRIVGLELGSDDYLPKPFEPRELIARIQSVLRRKAPGTDSAANANGGGGELKAENLVLDSRRRAASLDGKDIELTTTEFELLELFMREPDRVISRDEIMDRIRGEDWESFDRSVDVAVSRLRHKLGDPPKQPRFIKTVWGTGYRFICKVETSA